MNVQPVTRYSRSLTKKHIRNTCRCATILLAVLLAGGHPSPVALAGEFSQQVLRGKQIYTLGTSPSGGEITARIGEQAIPIPASAVPCASCHGPDGRGRPEGAVIPSDITWGYLTKNYGHQHPYGRRHPVFNEDAVATAIILGTDPGGNLLDTAMPRYTMSGDDMADLVAYLKRLEGDTDPGLEASRIRVGTVLPLEGSLAGLGTAMGEVMQAYFDDVNARGGIYGRKIELEIADSSGDPVTALRITRRLLAGGTVFALVSPVIAGQEEEIATLTEEVGIPLIGPFTLYPQDNLALNRYTFYLLAGLREQTRALIEYAATELDLQRPSLAMVYPDTKGMADIANAAAAQCHDHEWPALLHIAYTRNNFDPGQVIRKIQEQHIEAVLFLGSGKDLEGFTRVGAERHVKPYLLVPGALADRRILDIASVFKDRLYLAYPTLPVDHTAAGLAELRELCERHRLDTQHRLARISAYLAAKVLVAGLKRVGRDASREQLVTVLESFDHYETGLTQPLSFGAVRRIGALGAHIVSVDPQGNRLSPVGTWIDLGR